MGIFGYKIGYGCLSPADQRDSEAYAYACPYFGVGGWTFNNKIRTPINRDGSYLQKRPVIGCEKGLYIHVWLFNYRFDIDFRKRVMLENQN